MKKLFFILLICSVVLAQDQKPPAVTLHKTEVYNITSKINGTTYPIYIALPESYFTSYKSYPVIYMLDAYSSFGMMTEMSRLLAFNKEIPEAIIVGISSEGGSKEFIYNRARDYTPSHVEPDDLPKDLRLMTPASGGAEKFMNFIKDELIPFAESKFRCNKNDRTIVGHSYGGLFCFYSLFSQPEIFNRYVIISPAVQWDNELILEKEIEYSKKHKSLNAIIYTTIGSNESKLMIDEWKKLVASIKKHNYIGLVLKGKIAEDESHFSIIPYIAVRGLISVSENGKVK